MSDEADPIIEREHAILGMSSAERWSTCPASVKASEGLADTPSPAAYWGSANHLLSEICLKARSDPSMYFGQTVVFWYFDGDDSRGASLIDELAGETWPPYVDVLHTEKIDDEQVQCATTYVTYVLDILQSLPADAELEVERRVPIEHITKERGAKGTADAVITVPSMRLVIVIDLKGGMKEVYAYYEVPAVTLENLFEENPVIAMKKRPNKQLSGYGSGVIEAERFFEEFDEIELHIVQPRKNLFTSIRITTAELEAEIEQLRQAADRTRTDTNTFKPSYEACMFCKARHTCHARNAEVALRAVEGFNDEGEPVLRPVDLNNIGELFELVPFIKSWCKDIMDAALAAARNGQTIKGFKTEYMLVDGSRGNRKWIDPVKAETALKEYGASIYTQPELRSASQIEKLTTRRFGMDPIVPKAAWERVQQFIGYGDTGPPQLVPKTDNRTASTSSPSVLDGFESEDSSDGLF